MAEKMQNVMKNLGGKSKALIEEILARGMITESEVNLLRRRLNDGKIAYEDVAVLNDIKITQEQTNKGFEWLNRHWKDLGYREQDVLKNFKEFRLNSFTNNNNFQQQEMGIYNWIPVWDVIAKDGGQFQYIMEAGAPKIIG